eukprot:GHVO01040932.1.p1 GENE.GHVO01040932.1~~GHVO01040932.1.p1  ORF type:complete len:285 (+),score=38.64 GHVO01040932.1:81-935(+)
MTDSFLYSGRHMCLVFEKLGPSLYEFLSTNNFRGFFIADIQDIARQILQGLAFMSACKLTHTDLKPENILLAHARNYWTTYPRILPQLDGSSERHTLRPSSIDIRIIDFGSATFYDEEHSSLINTRQYRAPEVILDMGWDETSDMWSLGCIIMELYTGALLFKTHDHLEHLAMMEKIVGRFPFKMLYQANSADGAKFINLNRASIAWPGASTSEGSIRRVNKCVPLTHLVRPGHELLADFVGSLLHLDPKERPSPQTALGHRFLHTPIAEEGNTPRSNNWDTRR